MMRAPFPASCATRWLPMKPEPPNTTTVDSCNFMCRPLWQFARLISPWRDLAEARLERLRPVLEQGRIIGRIGHDVLDVLARLRKWNGFGEDRPFDRPGQARAPGA